MSFLSRLFGRKEAEQMRIGGMEDFMTLVRVYYQAAMAARLGISNLAAFPDLRVFKQTLTINWAWEKRNAPRRCSPRCMA